MTPKQKILHIEAIKTLVKSFGYVEDRWGNFKALSGDREYRIKIMSNNIRAEFKSTSDWYKVFSKPIVKMELFPLATWLANHRAN